MGGSQFLNNWIRFLDLRHCFSFFFWAWTCYNYCQVKAHYLCYLARLYIYFCYIAKSNFSARGYTEIQYKKKTLTTEMVKANFKKIKFLNLIMTHNQKFFHCLQSKLGDCWTSASIKPDLLDFFTSIFLQSNVLKLLSAMIFKRLGFDCGDSLRGISIFTRIFQPEAITSYLLLITLGVH